MVQLISRLKHRGWVFVSIIVVLFGIGFLNTKYSPPTQEPAQSGWTIRNTQPARALSPPQLLTNGYLWFPPDDNALIYQPFNGESPIVHTGLAGTPVKMRVARAGLSDVYHIVWLNDRDELWHAQLDHDGQFVLRPVRLAAAHLLDFDIAGLTGGGAVVLWSMADDLAGSILQYAVLDVQGRPRFDGRLLSPVDRFAFSIDVNDRVDVAWTATQTGDVTLQWANFSVQDLRTVTPLDLATLAQTMPIDLPDMAWLSNLSTLRDGQEILIVWGYATASSPEQTSYRIWSSRDRQSHPLTLQQDNEPVRLRWLGTVDHFSLFNRAPRLALTAYLDGAWRAVLAEVSAAGVDTYQVLGQIEDNASSPAVWYGAPDNILAAWVRLDSGHGLINTVVSNRPEDTARDLITEDETFTLGDALSGLRYIPYGLLWLVLPVGLVLANLDLSHRYQIPLMVGLYWISKVGASGDWLYHFPNGISWSQVTYMIVLGSMAFVPPIIALPFWIEARWRRYVLLALSFDAFLTILIFGSNLA